MARLLMMIGGVLFLAGLLIWAVGRFFPGVGRLPGDIVISKGNFTFYFPVMTSILVSIAVTVIFWLLRRF